ncbi:MAG: 4Fe-4S binding protein [Anaerolineae bacterium]|nr:4Fe-4S binding protein [Anaerolineae bacterium]MCO5186955.1 4Fe-4S binding protein [Anaerolineae bacterium]MCO5191998.1 4Fe-4S binding protein [Anaerolineae bacterium]MCO5199076.1 4Fe-4S binding protein [Anaerolineae bacterium]MCO5206971.1 4Fe-4S binding protein [Anaerolineae bacterium]
MYGTGIIKGLGVTLKHFVDTYVDDLRWMTRGGRYYNPDALKVRQSLQSEGVITVNYPEEKLPVPERFRFVPFLISDEPMAGQKYGKDWCTSCGICAKVCPPQCIWIKRGTLPNGRPNPQPEEFYIDIDICMNCGLCAEFCPFDAIKMDHDYELASYDRTFAHIHDKERLTKPISYWREIAPSRALAEAEVREAEAAAKSKKKGGGAREKRVEAAKERQATPAATATPAPAANVPPPPQLIEITDDMDPADIRKARIANSKAKSAYKKELKALGIDPASVEI